MIAGLIFLLIILIITTVVFGGIILRYRKMVKSYLDINTGRHGFYIERSWYYGSHWDVYVHVKEIDSFSNGYSQIELIRCESTYSSEIGKQETEKNARDKFVSLRLTNSIEWLEGKAHLRELRRSKLKFLSKKSD